METLKKRQCAYRSGAIAEAEMNIKTAKTETVKSSEKDFYVVGIGASAGGLAAFEAFFSGMPEKVDPGMAFVLIQHLAPDHKSMLNELVQRFTRMKVYEITDGIKVKPNCVYIIPPKHDIAFIDGTLQLLEPTMPRGLRLPIDFFFRSLAQEKHERAIAIILSGTGSDGTQGVRAIKAEGGMIIAQKPSSAEYDGMPNSAISTGLVDYELSPTEMAEQLIAYTSHAIAMPHGNITSPILKDENALKKIFVLLRSQTGHDFSKYKPNTIHRRIERRMVLHQIKEIGEYVKYLQAKPSEMEALFHEFLIGVTNFFRDPGSFEALEGILPRLFKDKHPGDSIRVWITGCSTGEEAYSIAIVLYEYMQELKEHYQVQLFATDIDPQAIAIARAGVYPVGIAADVSPERLARFFTANNEANTYRIHKNIRDMLIFSEQSVIKDPFFSRLDLISCRNLLIYMGTELQKKLIPLFHYALNPGGILFLGNSETTGEYSNLFKPLDLKVKLYEKLDDLDDKRDVSRFMPVSGVSRSLLPRPVSKSPATSKLPLRELTEQTLLHEITPAAVLVNSSSDILYLHGKAGIYLELPSGEVGPNNILKMAKEGLVHSLTMALHKAAVTKRIVKSSGVRIKTDTHLSNVNLTVCPVLNDSGPGKEAQFYLVIFEEGSLSQKPQENLALGTHNETGESDARVASLLRELRIQEEYLKTANEKLEISNEELRSSNEEVQSMNEELQSTNEELETSKEELQSVNEELSTVNTELQTKIFDLSRSNNDMNNLLAGTGIGTVFVDHNICILRFTPAVTKIINLIPSDLGRPVSQIVLNLRGYSSLKEDVQAVLETLTSKEAEVQTTDGRWYIMRIQPYRTLDNVIEGAVITFVEISETVKMREEIREANTRLLRLAIVVRDASDAITVQDLKGTITAWNPAAERIYGWSESEALKMNVSERIPKGRTEEALEKLYALKSIEILEPYRTQRLTKEGGILDVWITLTALVDEKGKLYAVATTERQIRTEGKEKANGR
jgi:two-component system CheB/CheR fusion protein